MGKKIQGSILNHLSDTKLRNCATTIKQKTTILAPFSDGASPGILVQLLCFSFFVKQSHQVPRCHVSGPTQFTVVAGMGKKLLGLTNKDAHVSFFFFFFFQINSSQVNCSMSVRFSSANMVANVIGIYELFCVPAPSPPIPQSFSFCFLFFF